MRDQRIDDVAKVSAAKAMEDRPTTPAIPDAEARVEVAAAMEWTRAAAHVAAVGLPFAAQDGGDLGGGRVARRAGRWLVPR
jgi:hypothetical protein